jgi:hypothetical protein
MRREVVPLKNLTSSTTKNLVISTRRLLAVRHKGTPYFIAWREHEVEARLKTAPKHQDLDAFSLVSTLIIITVKKKSEKEFVQKTKKKIKIKIKKRDAGWFGGGECMPEIF